MGHGGNVEEISRVYGINESDIIDFSANINPLGLSKNVKNKIINEIDKIERYPDISYMELKKAIADYENISTGSILLGNGAAEVIFNIARGLCPKEALLIAPTFIEYEDALKSVGCTIKYYKLNSELNLDRNFLESINENIDIVFICNPNNPTGLLTNKDLLVEIIKKGKETNTTIVIDESFIDFIEKKKDFSAIDMITKYKNLVVVKSLTKFFAIPGIRIGYGLTENEEYKSKINEVSVSWAVNTLASIASIEALKQESYINESIEYVKEESEFLYNGLKEFKDIYVFKGTANFLLFRCNRDINLKEKLLKENILIRSCDNYINLSNEYYRVAVRTREENLKLLKALSEALQ